MTVKDTKQQKLPIIGILGDGQLSMMMAHAYQGLGGQAFVYGGSDSSPASQVADKLFVGDTDDFENLEDFFRAVDVVTLENEFLDSSFLSLASFRYATPVLPDPNRFGLIEDKLSEKQFFRATDISIADFFEVKSEQDLLDTPGYLKLAKGGYDGIGTYRVDNREQAIAIFNSIKSVGKVLFEKAINYKKELSLIAVAGSSDLVFYPMVETHQDEGTCRYVSYPSGIASDIEREAISQVKRIMQKLDTRGVFAFEFFLTQDDQLILNESAPRPHNSGHISLDLFNCSQFENHMRAVAGLEIINPEPLHDSMLMVNLLGTQEGPFDADTVLSKTNNPQSSVVLYRKANSRLKRKMGHINFWGEDQRQRAESILLDLEI
ncbi:MAG: 5-(carboxyamino)imidazole ribonucleotide synthase [Cryomorphaceae bacterium]|jgi:5-(carboxyamino)imidazole ribonucleotide synthase